MATEQDLHSDLAIPTGEYLEEVFHELGITKDELAQQVGLRATELGAVFRGTTLLTPEMAIREGHRRASQHMGWTGMGVSSVAWEQSMMRYSLTYTSLRQRFSITEQSKATVSRYIREALEEGMITPVDVHAAKKLMKYVPFWA